MNRQGPLRFEIIDPAHMPLPTWPPPIQFLGDGDGTEKQILSELAVAIVDGTDRLRLFRSSRLRARLARRSRAIDRMSMSFARSPCLVLQGRELPRWSWPASDAARGGNTRGCTLNCWIMTILSSVGRRAQSCAKHPSRNRIGPAMGKRGNSREAQGTRGNPKEERLCGPHISMPA